jgi:hypothetical protein
MGSGWYTFDHVQITHFRYRHRGLAWITLALADLEIAQPELPRSNRSKLLGLQFAANHRHRNVPPDPERVATA